MNKYILNGRGFIYNPDGSVFFQHFRSRGNHIEKKFSSKFSKNWVDSHNEKAFYAGVKFDHYGHFILESLSRLSNFNNEKTIVWQGFGEFSSWQKEILYNLGLDHVNHLIINECHLFNNLSITSPEYIIWDKFTNKHSSFLAFNKNSPSTKRKIWLSRSKLNDLEGWENEKIIENYLRNNGWEIIHPEDMTVKEQVELFNHDGIVSGIEGSAFHNVVFLEKVHCQIKIFNRRGNMNGNYNLIANTKNLTQENIKVDWLTLKTNGQTKKVVNEKDVFKHLSVNVDNAFPSQFELAKKIYFRDLQNENDYFDYLTKLIDYSLAKNKVDDIFAISNILKNMPQKNRAFSFFKGLALSIENHNNYLSLYFYNKANEIKPNGEFITNKIKQIKEKI